MFEYQILLQKKSKYMKFYSRPIYTQSNIDEKTFVEYQLCDILLYDNYTRETMHSYVRKHLDNYGVKTNIYMVITKFGVFKYIFNRRPATTYPHIIKFSPKRDGECDIINKEDLIYLQQRWRVFNYFIDDNVSF